MKTKNLKIWAGVMATLIAMMNLVPMVSAAETSDITVTVMVSYLSISLNVSSIGFNIVKTSSSSVSGPINVTNDGNWPINLTLKQTCTSGSCNWTVGGNITGALNITEVGANQYVLAANFSDSSLGASGFTNNSVLTTTTQMAINEKFGSPSNGLNIAAGSKKDLWLLFKAPTTNTQRNQQTITVTIGAVAA